MFTIIRNSFSLVIFRCVSKREPSTFYIYFSFCLHRPFNHYYSAPVFFVFSTTYRTRCCCESKSKTARVLFQKMRVPQKAAARFLSKSPSNRHNAYSFLSVFCFFFLFVICIVCCALPSYI